MKYQKKSGDVTCFDVLPDTFHFVPHNLNCDGVWGSGVVVPIFKKWDLARAAYEDWYDQLRYAKYSPKCLDQNNDMFGLGNLQIVNVEKSIFVVNMLAQKWVGAPYDMVPGRYEAIEECLLKLKICFDKVNKVGKKVQVESPKFGACRSGLEWEAVFDIVKDIFEDTDGIWTTYSYEGAYA